MKLSDYALKQLSKVVCGDEGGTKYFKGQELADLFNRFGERDIYDFGNGGLPKIEGDDRNPSRKDYTFNKLKKFNESEKLKNLIEFVALQSLNDPLDAMNKIMVPEGYKLEKLNNVFTVTGTPVYQQAVTADVHFEGIQRQILEELDKAKFVIYVAVAWFTDKVLFDKLVELKKKGVHVEIVISDDQINKNSGLGFEQEFNIKRIPKTTYDNIMHNKFCVVDLRTVISGSYNWSKRAQYNQENITVINNYETAEKFALEFKQIKDS